VEEAAAFVYELGRRDGPLVPSQIQRMVIARKTFGNMR
jgi:hypothetical protein